MAFYDKFPYTNFQEINLDRIIQQLVEVQEDLQFVIDNASLKYADPIQWSITSQYQANTVVIDPATGIAYLSTRPVPVNILITNTDYWTPVFDLSAMIGGLQDDITDETNARIAADNALADDISDEATARANAINTETNARIAADNALRTLINKKWLVIADSYGVVGGPVLGTLLSQYSHFTSSYYYAKDGCAFGKSGALNFLSILTDHETDITDKTNITDIMVIGGYNDWGQDAIDIKNGMDTFATYCRTNYPNAVVHLACVGHSTGLEGRTLAITSKVIPTYKQFAGQYGMSYVQNSEYILHSPTYFATDKIHPNQTGIEVLARYLAGYMRGRELSVMTEVASGALPITPATGVTFGSQSRLYFRVNNDVTTAFIQDLRITFSPTVSMASSNTPGDGLVIGTVNPQGAGMLWPSDYYGGVNIPLMLYVNATGTNGWSLVNAVLRFTENGNVTIVPALSDSAGFTSITGISQIRTFNFTTAVNVPTLALG